MFERMMTTNLRRFEFLLFRKFQHILSAELLTIGRQECSLRNESVGILLPSITERPQWVLPMKLVWLDHFDYTAHS